MTGNPIGFARGAYGIGSFATDVAGSREAAGMPSLGGPGSGLGNPGEAGGDSVMAQSTSQGQLRIGEKGGLESGLLDSPLESAYQRDFGEVKKAALLAALKGGAQ